MTHTIKSILQNTGVYLDNITRDGVNHSIEYLSQDMDTPHLMSYLDMNDAEVALLDITATLTPKILSKGVFETIDCRTQKPVSIQFYRHVPFNISE